MKLQYRDTTYFNENDYYVFEDLNRYFVSKVHFEKGYWWTNESLQFKATTMECVNFKDLVGRKVKTFHHYKSFGGLQEQTPNDGVEGKIWQCLPPYDFGIIWKQGKKPGLPYHFTNINQLELL